MESKIVSLLNKKGIKVKGSDGIQQKVLCPTCSKSRKKKTDPCLSVNIETGLYHCFNCGYSGGVVAGNNEVKEVVSKKNYTLPKYDQAEWQLNDECIEYFKTRGISKQTLEANKIGSAVTAFTKDSDDQLVIAFPYMKGDTVVNVKYRTVDKQMRSVKGAESCFYGIQNLFEDGLLATKKIHIVEGECFPFYTDVLTPSGWVNIRDFVNNRNTSIAQWSKDGISFVKPLAYIKKKCRTNLLKRVNKKRYSLTTTRQHNLVGENSKGIIKKFSADSHIPTAYNAPRVGFIDGSGIDLTDSQIRLNVAVSADASFQRNGRIKISFKKQRKIDRFRELLDTTGVEYTESVQKNGYTFFGVERKDWMFGRMFPHSWIADLSLHQRILLLDELVFWDGNTVPNRNQTEYSSKYEENAVFVQTLAHTTGKVSTVIHRENAYGKWFKVSILYNKTYTSYQSISNPEEVEYNGEVFCVTVPSGMLIVRQDECISVTGNCDLLSLYEAGFKYTLSVPNGASVEEEGRTKVVPALPFLDDPDIQTILTSVDEVVFVTDADYKGRRLREELATRIGIDKCFTVEYPPDCKDANDVLVKYGVEHLLDVILDAKPMLKGLVQVSDLNGSLQDFYKHGLESGLRCGIEAFDELYTLQTGLITLVTGTPESFKSVLLDNLLVGYAKQNGIHTALFSPETKPLELHVGRLACIDTGLSLDSESPNYMSYDEFKTSAEWLNSKFSLIQPKVATLEEILALAKVSILKNGTKILVIDPYSRIRVDSDIEHSYIKNLLNEVGEFAVKYDVHVFIVAHPTKMTTISSKGSRNYPIVTPYHIAHSSNWFNSSDFILSLWKDRNDSFQPIKVYCLKSKYHHIAKSDKHCELYYDFDNWTFS